MNKLQQGDYVTDLTEEQFSELMTIARKDLKITDNANLCVMYFNQDLILTLKPVNVDIHPIEFEEFKNLCLINFGWISVENELPKNLKEVQVIYKNKLFIAMYSTQNNSFCIYEKQEYSKSVTHWVPLSERP